MMCDVPAFMMMAMVVVGMALAGGVPARGATLSPKVEIEEDVYSFDAPENGSGPMWAYGSSAIARVGEEVFISGESVIPGVEPLNNRRWDLYHRVADGWEMVAQGPGRTREPCLLASFPDGSLFLSDNPTLTPLEARDGPARPEIFRFQVSDLKAAPTVVRPKWEGEPRFSEHSYRSFAADGPRKELVLFQNVWYTHSEWAFMDAEGKWSATGQLVWPWGGEYPEPQPIRVCYPTVALKDRAAYFCGVSDIVEPYPVWRDYKREVSGRDWDYDFRRLFFTWSDDITTGKFHDWIEVSSRDKTCGWVFPCDLWVGPDGAVHLLWTERAIDTRLREKFFPEERQTESLMYAVLRDGKVVSRQALVTAEEGGSREVPGRGRFHVSADGRLFVLYPLQGDDAAGQWVSEDRLVEIKADGTVTEPVTVPLKNAFTSFYTAGWRNGTAPSDTMDIYGKCADKGPALSYARIRVK